MPAPGASFGCFALVDVPGPGAEQERVVDGGDEALEGIWEHVAAGHHSPIRLS
jgi:hypothetical protein